MMPVSTCRAAGRSSPVNVPFSNSGRSSRSSRVLSVKLAVPSEIENLNTDISVPAGQSFIIVWKNKEVQL